MRSYPLSRPPQNRYLLRIVRARQPATIDRVFNQPRGIRATYQAAGQKGPFMRRFGWRVHPESCTGCGACVKACQQAFAGAGGSGHRRWRSHLLERSFGAEFRRLSTACYHCDAPACMDLCPSGAISRGNQVGAVTVETRSGSPNQCIGCGFCVEACPHDIPRLDPIDGKMRKCDFCLDRLKSGAKPICVEACPTGSLGVEPALAECCGTPPLGFGGCDGTRPCIHFVREIAA